MAEAIRYRKLAWCWLYIQAPAFLYDELKNRYGFVMGTSYTAVGEFFIMSIIVNILYGVGRSFGFFTLESYIVIWAAFIAVWFILAILALFINGSGLSGVLCSIHDQSLILKENGIWFPDKMTLSLTTTRDWMMGLNMLRGIFLFTQGCFVGVLEFIV